MGSFFHRIMWSLWGEYFQRLRSISFCFWTGINCVSGSCDCHKIGKRTSGSKYSVKVSPLQEVLHQVIDFKFHQGETWSEFICIDRSVDSRCHHCSEDRILIKSTKQCVMKMRMVWFGLLVEYFLNLLQKFVLLTGLLLYLKIDLFFELLWPLDFNYFILAF